MCVQVLLKLVAKPAFAASDDGEAITLQSPGVVALFCVYSVVSIVSCIGIMFIPEVPVDAKVCSFAVVGVSQIDDRQPN
mgnify:CR=1 FL=1